MADLQIGNTAGVTAVSVGGGTNPTNVNGGANNAPQAGLDIDEDKTIAALRTALTAINAGYYTTDVLNTMTKNDMLYAVRVASYPTSIK